MKFHIPRTEIPSEVFANRSIEEIRHSLDFFENIKTKKKSYDEILDFTKRTFQGVNLPRYRMQVSFSEDAFVEGYGIYRARRVEGYKPFCLVEQLMHPKPERVEYVRCNKTGKPIFYCSNHITTALLECGAKVGDRFVISRFDHNENKSLKFLSAIALGISQNRFIANTNVNTQKQGMLVDPYKDREKNNLVTKSLEKIFSSCVPKHRKHFYKKTSAVVEFFTMQNHVGEQIYTVFYPSVVRGVNSYNLAIKPREALMHLDLVDVMIVKIESVNTTNVKMSQLRNGFIDLVSGRIEWS